MPVSPGLVTVPLPLVLISPMYVSGTTLPQPCHLYLGSLEALYDVTRTTSLNRNRQEKKNIGDAVLA